MYYMWFMAQNGGFRDYTNAATIAHLTGIRLKNLPTPLPPLALQCRFAAVVESVEQQRARQRAHLAELDTLFATLQNRAFRGDL
jgi:type I restriction enzyme S subunit